MFASLVAATRHHIAASSHVGHALSLRPPPSVSQLAPPGPRDCNACSGTESGMPTQDANRRYTTHRNTKRVAPGQRSSGRPASPPGNVLRRRAPRGPGSETPLADISGPAWQRFLTASPITSAASTTSTANPIPSLTTAPNASCLAARLRLVVRSSLLDRPDVTHCFPGHVVRSRQCSLSSISTAELGQELVSDVGLFPLSSADLLPKQVREAPQTSCRNQSCSPICSSFMFGRMSRELRFQRPPENARTITLWSEETRHHNPHTSRIVLVYEVPAAPP